MVAVRVIEEQQNPVGPQLRQATVSTAPQRISKVRRRHPRSVDSNHFQVMLRPHLQRQVHLLALRHHRRPMLVELLVTQRRVRVIEITSRSINEVVQHLLIHRRTVNQHIHRAVHHHRLLQTALQIHIIHQRLFRHLRHMHTIRIAEIEQIPVVHHQEVHTVLHRSQYRRHLRQMKRERVRHRLSRSVIVRARLTGAGSQQQEATQAPFPCRRCKE